MKRLWIPFALLVVVALETEKGKITLELDDVKAPVTVANFLKYVDAGRYNGGKFHRTVRPDNQPKNPVKIEVIQGSAAPPEPPEKDAITLERTSVTGLKHVDGTISMARDGPDTATADFFICLGAQPELDFGGKRNPDGQGFAAFGRVTKGMKVVKKIQQGKAKDQTLEPPVAILRAYRVR